MGSALSSTKKKQGLINFTFIESLFYALDSHHLDPLKKLRHQPVSDKGRDVISKAAAVVAVALLLATACATELNFDNYHFGSMTCESSEL